jgi:aryl-alcohol dehydrogenase-like predicted oxidoreductase
MDTRVTFGSTNLQVSPFSFGTWQLSPRFWGAQPEEELIAAMQAAFDNGINFYDTAEAYGDGLAETVLGKFIKRVPRDQVVITTKVFNHFNPDGSRYPDLSRDYVMQRCEMSLERLGIECIDVYLLHFYDQLTPLAEITETLETLKRQGKIRHYGGSNFTTEQFRAARKFGAYNVMQPPYSFIDFGVENELLPYCQAEDVGVMIFSPMHKGLLTGKYTGVETFDDFRQHHPDFQGERFQQICDGVRSLRPMADKYALTLYQLILAATLMHPSIQVAVVGIKTADQIKEAAGALGKTLSREDYFAVRNAVNVAGQKKVRDATGKVK